MTLFAEPTTEIIEECIYNNISTILSIKLIILWLPANKLTIYANMTHIMILHGEVDILIRQEKLALTKTYNFSEL